MAYMPSSKPGKFTDVKKGGQPGKGSVPLFVIVLNFGPSVGYDFVTFQLCSDRALSSHYSVPFTKNSLSEDS
jgi:hypothetical protein